MTHILTGAALRVEGTADLVIRNFLRLQPEGSEGGMFHIVNQVMPSAAPRPAFGYGQALPDTPAAQWRGYGNQIRGWAKLHDFRVIGVFLDSHPERAPQFVKLIRSVKRLDVRPMTLIVPNRSALYGASSTDVEKMILLRRYDLTVVVADEG
jgi:hypothetical protein